ncbi:MAG TPA: hypothetical protein VFZ32_15945 [Micromonosporaceae bacterium]
MQTLEPKPSRRFLPGVLIGSVVVVLLIGVGAAIWWRDSGGDAQGGRVAAPDGLVVRVRDREDLSHLSEGGHEPAVLLYRLCQQQGCEWRTVFRDGRQYLLHHVTDDSLSEELTGLSPNGRIVAVPTDAGMMFRDLVAGTMQPAGSLRRYQGGGNGTRRAWSDDGRWLVHYNGYNLGIMVDTVTGEPHRLPENLGDITIVGVTRDGRLLTIAPPKADARGIGVAVAGVDDLDRAEYRTVDLSGVLKARENLTDGRDGHVEAYASPDSTRIAVTVRRTDDDPGDVRWRMTAVLIIDLASGTVVKRHDVAPDTTVACGWDATGVQVLTGHPADPDTGGNQVAVHWLDPWTGEERARATIRGEARKLSLRC